MAKKPKLCRYRRIKHELELESYLKWIPTPELDVVLQLWDLAAFPWELKWDVGGGNLYKNESANVWVDNWKTKLISFLSVQHTVIPERSYLRESRNCSTIYGNRRSTRRKEIGSLLWIVQTSFSVKQLWNTSKCVRNPEPGVN